MRCDLASFGVAWLLDRSGPLMMPPNQNLLGLPRGTTQSPGWETQGPQPQRQRLMVVGTRLGLDGSVLDQSDSELADLI